MVERTSRMPLDEATRRFAFLLQRDLRRIEERDRDRQDRREEVRYDAVSRLATWETRRGDVVGRWYGEPLATYNARDRILRWAWAFRSTAEVGAHVELVFREGESRDVPQLTMSVVAELDQEEALALGRLGAVAARAEGIFVRRLDEDHLEIIGLFDSPRPSDRLRLSEGRISIPPPPVNLRVPTPPPPSASGSRPPALEPTRSRILPLANVVVAAMSQKCPGFRQGLLVVSVGVDTDAPKRHLVVQLVVLDADALLRSLDPPRDVIDAAAEMIGDARWRKVTARITPKPDGGATLHVDVV